MVINDLLRLHPEKNIVNYTIKQVVCPLAQQLNRFFFYLIWMKVNFLYTC